jgi:hypothetical protein
MYQEEKEGIVQNFQYNYFLKHAALKEWQLQKLITHPLM